MYSESSEYVAVPLVYGSSAPLLGRMASSKVEEDSLWPTRSPHRLVLSVPPPHIVTDGGAFAHWPRKETNAQVRKCHLCL